MALTTRHPSLLSDRIQLALKFSFSSHCSSRLEFGFDPPYLLDIVQILADVFKRGLPIARELSVHHDPPGELHVPDRYLQEQTWQGAQARSNSGGGFETGRVAILVFTLPVVNSF